MGNELTVVLDESSGEWVIRDGDRELGRFRRLEDARARVRAILLERGKGSAVIYTPSGRPRERLVLQQTETGSLQVA
jgi:hypothetical protein